MRKSTITALLIFIFSAGSSQVPLSFSSDLNVLHNFKKQQRYWAIGAHLQFCFHVTPKDGIYSWFGFYTNGKFTNHLVATAKSTATIPQQVNYTDTTQMHFQHISFGWKKYLKGLPLAEKGWNLYSSAGFGLMLGKLNNYSNRRPDSLIYGLPIRGGEARFKRLTLDLALGVEFPFASDMYLYSDTRLFIPTTDYPSKYIFVNEKAPMVGSIGVGIRILF